MKVRVFMGKSKSEEVKRVIMKDERGKLKET